MKKTSACVTSSNRGFDASHRRVREEEGSILDGRLKREGPKPGLFFESFGHKLDSLFSSFHSKPAVDDVKKLDDRIGGMHHRVAAFHGSSILAASSDGEGVVAHEDVSEKTGSPYHKTSETYFYDGRGGVSGVSCIDSKCKKQRVMERRRRTAPDNKAFPSGKTLQAELLNNVLNTLQSLGEKLQELQNKLAQSFQSTVVGPGGVPPAVHLPDSPATHLSGAAAAAGGSSVVVGGGPHIQGEFHGSSISSSTSPSGQTVVSHKEVVDRVGSPSHTSSGSYVVNPQGEVSVVSCTDGKCHKVGGEASKPDAAATAPLGNRAGAAGHGNVPETHFSSSSFAVDPSGHVTGVSCVDGKCKSTGDDSDKGAGKAVGKGKKP